MAAQSSQGDWTASSGKGELRLVTIKDSKRLSTQESWWLVKRSNGEWNAARHVFTEYNAKEDTTYISVTFGWHGDGKRIPTATEKGQHMLEVDEERFLHLRRRFAETGLKTMEEETNWAVPTPSSDDS